MRALRVGSPFEGKAQAAMVVGLVDFYKHTLWANLRLLDACAHLTDEQLDASAPGTYGRIGDTLVHLFRAEAAYVARLTGHQSEGPLGAGAFPGIETLREHARRSGEGLIAVAGTVDLMQSLRGTYRGEPYEMPVMVPLMQAIHHATDHRSHVATVLSQLGMEPPDLSVWAYAGFREQWNWEVRRGSRREGGSQLDAFPDVGEHEPG